MISSSLAGWWWLPAAAVGAMAALALVATAAQPARPARKYWLATVLVGAALTLGASVWQLRADRAALRDAAAQRRGSESRLQARVEAQNARIADLENRLSDLRAAARHRAIPGETAAKLASELREKGSHRVVVSCAPDDVEAFAYATQIANLLRTAGWEALGPEATTIFGEAPAMGLRLYVRGGSGPPEAAAILIDAFTRFNIPFESGLTPSDAIPDPATTEIFVSRKP
ncbi:MAG TPA: hypothetical protein VJR70_00400 [Stellaceae bacterium]|nr:hypothetical protein [Stellaceae bacterium]